MTGGMANEETPSNNTGILFLRLGTVVVAALFSILMSSQSLTKPQTSSVAAAVLTVSNASWGETNFNSTLSATRLDVVKSQQTLNPPNVLNDEVYDLVFWYRSGAKLPKSSFIVTRNQFSDNTLAPDGFDVLRADFRLCDKECAELSDRFPTQNISSIEESWRYQHFVNHTLTLYYEADSWYQPSIPFQEVTFWSSSLQRHVSVKHIIPAMFLEACKSVTCPQSCPQNLKQGPSPYPFIQDTKDGVCKSLHPDVFPPKRSHGGKCRCESTCFTPEAGDPKSFWPWTNESEFKRFRPRGTDVGYRQCEHERSLQSFEPRFICPKDMEKSLPCAFRGAFSHHLFFIPKAKLIFCGIPKAGVTEWIKFFRYVIGAKDYLSLPHYKKDRENFFVKSLDPRRAQSILKDPTWTKAFFIRNPLDRLLSAYFDKIVGQGYTQKVFKLGDVKDKNRSTLTFDEYVDRVTNTTIPVDCNDPNGLKACTDPHWRPQMMTCGLDYMLPSIDFIGNFDHIAEHTKLLLEKVGIWDEFGSTFDDGLGGKRSNMCWVPPVKRRGNATTPGFNQRGPSGNGGRVHATDSKSKFEQMYTPELIEKVRRAYHLDFAVWDEVSKQTLPINQVLSGRDIPEVQQQCSE